MRAVITGTPLQIEGEPAEIAQLVELLSTGAVLVEHVHHWKLADLDGSESVTGRCWCGQERQFNPIADRANNNPLFAKATTETNGVVPVVASNGVKKQRTCKVCGQVGHDIRKCPQAVKA